MRKTIAEQLLNERAISTYEQITALKGIFEEVKGGRENFSEDEIIEYRKLTSAQDTIQRIYKYNNKE